jgi:GAF domain-containing protein
MPRHVTSCRARFCQSFLAYVIRHLLFHSFHSIFSFLTSDDERLLSHFAALASLAVKNAKLLNATSTALQQSDALVGFASDISPVVPFAVPSLHYTI